MGDVQRKRLFLKDEALEENASGVAYTCDLERLLPRPELVRHAMDGDEDLHIDDRERNIVRRLDIVDDDVARPALDSNPLSFHSEFSEHIHDIIPGAI